MKLNYTFLKDELALIEIRKHQWIQSEKTGKTVGFATAAVDWIKKHGKQWVAFRMDAHRNSLSERRSFRRYNHRLPLEITYNNKSLTLKSNDVSLIGLSCALPHHVPSETPVNVLFKFNKEKQIQTKAFKFKSRILRIETINKKASPVQPKYQAFLPFNEKVRDFLRSNADYLS